MGKTKSIVITVLLALAMAVAAFFAVVSFDVGVSKRYNSILSNVSLGADFTGYAYTTVCPEGVITVSDYNGLVDAYENAEDRSQLTDPATIYVQYGNYYVNTEEYSGITEEGFNIDALKSSVAADAKILNARFGEKGYSSYSVAVEDGLSIKISVPTYFTSAEFKKLDEDGRSNRISVAQLALSALTSDGKLTLRTSDTSIETTDANGNAKTYDMTKLGDDEWTDKATVSDSSGNTINTYSLSKDDVAPYFKSVTGGTIGSTPVLTFNFTAEGREKIKEITTLVASSSSQTLYFFVGDTQLVGYSSCTSPIDQSSISLQTNDAETARNIAITLDSAVKGNVLTLSYGDVSVSTQQSNGEISAILTLVACLLLLAGLAVLLIVKYKKLGAITAAIALLMALVEVYALQLLSITVTFAVVFTCALLIALFAVSCAIVYAEVKRLTLTGRTIQASIKEAYKNVLMTITDLHIVLAAVAILLAAVGVGEVAACGLISVIGVVASYVLYWFTRFMWYVTSSPEKDKFKFAGLKRVVYEDD
ncbi:MAG: hypothetical protein ACI4MQ_01620 [Candidatus Coproplasma sp.]